MKNGIITFTYVKVHFSFRKNLVCKIFVFLFNYFVTIIISTNLSKFLYSLFSESFDSDVFRDLQFYKIIVLIIALTLVILILEPEKLKVIT